MSNYSFENLTQSGLVKIPSKDDKNVSLSIDSFGGMTSFAVWTGSGGKPWKLNLPRKTINNFLILLNKLKDEPRPHREAIFVNAFDQESKRFKQVGQIGLGIDENLQFQIDIAHNDLPGGRFIFPVKPHGNFDFSNTSLSEKEILQGLINWVIEVLSLESVVAERMSSFKKQFGSNNNNNRGNYNNNSGGNRNYNNNSGGGYNSRPPENGGSFGGDPVVESDLHI